MEFERDNGWLNKHSRGAKWKFAIWQRVEGKLKILS